MPTAPMAMPRATPATAMPTTTPNDCSPSPRGRGAGEGDRAEWRLPLPPPPSSRSFAAPPPAARPRPRAGQPFAVLLHHLLRRAAHEVGVVQLLRDLLRASPAALSRSRVSRARSAPRSIAPASGSTIVASSSTSLRRALRHLAVQRPQLGRARQPPDRLDPALAARQRLRRGVAQQDRRQRRRAARSSRRAPRAPRRSAAPPSRVPRAPPRRPAPRTARARARGSGCTARRSRTGPTAPRSRTASPDAAGAAMHAQHMRRRPRAPRPPLRVRSGQQPAWRIPGTSRRTCSR